MHIVFLLLGSNLGDKLSWIEKARNRIEGSIGRIINRSSVYQTEPWGFKHEEDFYNQVIQIESMSGASQILSECLKIEEEMGRIRKQGHYEARIIDIDILFYDDQIIQDIRLEIPHPKMHLRKFTLIPMCEIASQMIHPLLRKNMKQLLEESDDRSRVQRIE